MGSRVLVTGGAGYVGSHCARRLAEEGFEVVTLDDLSEGYAEAAVGELVAVDLRDRAGVERALAGGFDAVLHFAALMSVGDSVTEPVAYYDVNVGGTLSLLAAMEKAGCDKLVFSSTCAVYGVPERVPIDESNPHAPISPYGETKAAVERILAHARRVGRVRSVSLRYFNACGASEDGHLGEAHDPETHVIPVALHAVAHGGDFSIFGTDYPTPDGTCVRDYVHVLDLAEAHLAAVRHLLDGGPGGAFNLGTGNGNSVREVIDTVERVTGLRFGTVHERPRREGDPPFLVADPRRVKETLRWEPTRTLEDAVRSGWAWYRNPRYGPRRAPPSP